MQDSDVLWGMYQEHCTQGRHHEDQRSTTANLILALGAAATGLISFKDFTKDMWPLAVLVALLGLFGALFSLKHYERFRYHMKCAGEFRKALEKVVPKTQLQAHLNNARSQHAADSRYALVRGTHLFIFWLALNLLLSAFGTIVLVLLLSKR